MIATLPHFYKAEQLLDGIESGLNPNKTFHELYAHLEIVSLRLIVNAWNEELICDDFSLLNTQLTGVPVSAAKRLQFNLNMKPIPQIEIMKNMPEILFPLCWLEESIVLEKQFLDQLKLMYWWVLVFTKASAPYSY